MNSPEARIALLREQVLPLIGEALSETHFLDAGYCKRYAYQHRDRILQNRGELTTYFQWVEVPEWNKNQLCDRSIRKVVESVWIAKRDLVQIAGKLSDADIASWEAKEARELGEADELGLTTEEMRERRLVEAAVLEDFHGKLGADIVNWFGPFGGNVKGAAEGIHAEMKRAVQDPDPNAEQREPPERVAWMTIKLRFTLYRKYIGILLGQEIHNVEQIEDELFTAMKADDAFKDDATRLDLCVSSETVMHAAVKRSLEEMLERLEAHGPWGPYKVEVPYREWFEPYFDRLGEQRTAEDLRSHMEQVG